eukprot:GILK01011843.1.p1 GENE.GILK01011843.1~~GILK01011843.1.p1  ORF type:complete len:137 (-),score=17.18 GILK01011843.1:157-567(-)
MQYGGCLLFVVCSESYRDAKGMMIVYDVTDEVSFNSIDMWMSRIEQHAPENVVKVLVGNRIDLSKSRVIPTSSGRAVAERYGMEFFETSAKDDINVSEVFMFLAERVLSTRVHPSDGDLITLSSGTPSRSGRGCYR